MMRGAVRLFLPIFATFLLAACSGADAQRASDLLVTAQAAQAKVASATYDVRVSVTQGVQSFTLLMNGGGYVKGPRAGEQFLSMRVEGLPVPLSYEFVARTGRGYVRANGAWQSFALPAGSAGAQSSNWTGTVGQLARYVKSVDVSDSTIVAGETGTQ